MSAESQALPDNPKNEMILDLDTLCYPKSEGTDPIPYGDVLELEETIPSGATIEEVRNTVGEVNALTLPGFLVSTLNCGREEKCPTRVNVLFSTSSDGTVLSTDVQVWPCKDLLLNPEFYLPVGTPMEYIRRGFGDPAIVFEDGVWHYSYPDCPQVSISVEFDEQSHVSRISSSKTLCF
jgi:hypothetical protein